MSHHVVETLVNRSWDTDIDECPTTLMMTTRRQKLKDSIRSAPLYRVRIHRAVSMPLHSSDLFHFILTNVIFPSSVLRPVASPAMPTNHLPTHAFRRRQETSQSGYQRFEIPERVDFVKT